jgi:membrane protease YdiL (CAAX protease family)
VSPLVRWCAAALLIAGGLQLSGWVRQLTAYAKTNPGRLGFEMMGIEVGLLFVAVALAWALPGRIPDRLGLRAPRLPIHAIAALVIGTLGLSHTLEALLMLSQQAEHSVVTGIPRAIARTAATPSELWIALLGSVIAPAVGEELLCRGLVQRTIVRWTGPGLAIALASVVFGTIHTEWIHGTFAFLIGLYLGLGAYWADSSWPAIAAHAANNLGALLASTGLLVVPMPLPLALFGGAAVAALGLVSAARSRPRGTDAPVAVPEGLQPDAESADA